MVLLWSCHGNFRETFGLTIGKVLRRQVMPIPVIIDNTEIIIVSPLEEFRIPSDNGSPRALFPIYIYACFLCIYSEYSEST